MFNTNSPELFMNIKKVPDITSKEYRPFFQNEMKKVKEGVTINGIYIGGWLYWHINHWVIDIDISDFERETRVPYLRDNEWAINEALVDAEKLRKGLLLLGSRQLGKSEFGASYLGRRSIGYKNSQNIVAGLSEPDLDLLLSKTQRGFVNLHPYFRPLRIKDNWSTKVEIGYKTPQGEPRKFSEILIRNIVEGKKSEALAGPTASSLLIDEIGKGPFINSFIGSRPALETEYGWRATPIFTGTSGNFEKSQDLQNFRANLSSYNFMEIMMKDHENKTVHFIPGCYASRSKRKRIRLSTYLGLERGSELDHVPIRIVEDKPAEIVKRDLQIAAYEKANDFVSAKREKMYYPAIEDDLFLIDDKDNIFAEVKELCKNHLAYLNSIEYPEEYGFMDRDEKGKARFTKSDKYPIANFPIKDEEDKDAPIIIWDHPLEGQQFGILHVSGSDPYNQDESYYSSSLGTLYVYRRLYDPVNGRFNNSFVASYTARPKNMEKWYLQVRLLMEYYNATCFPENESKEFIRYFDNRNLTHWLDDGLDLAREINPGTKVGRHKGLSASTPNINYGNRMLKAYLLEELVMGQDLLGENIIQHGVIRIRDKVLLKEIIAYKPGGNFDRIVAARHALIIANLKDKFYPTGAVKNAPTNLSDKPRPRKTSSPFTGYKGGSFASRARRPF